MRLPQLLLLAVCLLAPATLGGCISAQAAKDYWNDEGRIVVKLGTLPADAPGQRVQDFSELKIAVRGVIVTPVGEIAPVAGATYSPSPFGIDLVMRQEEGEGKKILERTIRTKTIESARVQLLLVSAVTKTGETIPACAKEGAERVRPCIALPTGGQFVLDKSFDPPQMKRGKTLTLEFPIALMYNKNVNEYYLQSRSAKEEAPVHLS